MRNRKFAGLRKEPDPVRQELAATEETEVFYERMIPVEFLKLLRVKRYSDLRVGDQQYFSSVIMDVNMADLTELVRGNWKVPLAGTRRNVQVDEVFALINRMMNQVIPVVYSHNGIVEEFQGGGFRAFFPNIGGGESPPHVRSAEYAESPPHIRSAEYAALSAAVSLCETLNRMDGQGAGESPPHMRSAESYESVTVGLHYGSVMIGVVGHERRMTILTLSEAKGFAGSLRAIGSKYGAKIVVTSTFLNQIEGRAGKFNYRLLGYIRLRTDHTLEKLYDVFDGDVVAVRNRKRRSKMVFEKGVKLFTEQRLPEARQHFIEVLKMAPADKAAKHYLLRCDEYLGSDCEREIFIETC